MLKNYITIALRNIRKTPGYTAINLAGLSVGFAVCLLIGIFIQFHLEFDSHLPHADQLYRVTNTITGPGEEIKSGRMEGPMAATLIEELPSIKSATRIHMAGKSLITVGNRSTHEDGIMQTDPAFFEMFSVSFIYGSGESALSSRNDIVLTRNASEKYFGSDENPLGKTIVIDESTEYNVSGVIENPVEQTHLDYTMLINIPKKLYGVEVNSWKRLSAFFTYLLLEPGSSPQEVANTIPSVLKDKIPASTLEQTRFELQPISEIHLKSNLRGELIPERIFDIRYIYLFASVGLLILIIAGINYVNLATARAFQRLKEIGIRKTAGARRMQLFGQFISESVLIAAGSALIGLLLAEYGISFLNNLMQLDISVIHPWSVSYLPIYFLTALFIGMFAGFYPAWYLSSLNPSRILKGNTGHVLSGESLRKILVTVQFAISLTLVISTIVIYQQLNHIQQKNLGLKPDQVMYIELETSGANEVGLPLAERIRRRTEIRGVTAASDLPGKGGLNLRLYPHGRDEDPMPIRYTRADSNYLQVLGIELIAGRNFTYSDTERKEPVAIINETAAREMGWNSGEAPGMNLERFHVIGVVRDYHTASLKNEIKPVVITPLGENKNPSILALKLPSDRIKNTINVIQQEWKSLMPNYPLVYNFLDDTFESFYRAENRFGLIFTTFSVVAVVIAGMGLFGLVAFMCAKRAKEIGIRKVLGASVGNVVALLSRDYIKLMAIGLLIASPVAWYLMNRWLQDFAYRIDIGSSTFLLAGGAALFIVLITVSWQSYQAAMTNPVESIRNE